MSCEMQKSLTLRSPPSCTSNNIDHVAESSRERLCRKKPFFISLFSAKINRHQPPRKMAFVVGLPFKRVQEKKQSAEWRWLLASDAQNTDASYK